ncbi:hypothetical protein ACFQX7_33765 [Luedemannella flava]
MQLGLQRPGRRRQGGLRVCHAPSGREGEEAAASALQLPKGAGEPYLPALAGLLDDPDDDVRRRAIWAIGEVGWAAVPLLRQIRRGGARKRRAALTTLADIGGWDALEEADQRAVTRLIEVKAAHEVPEPMHLCGTWYALPTTDQAAVLDAFELTRPTPVTMRLGGSAWNNDLHNWSSVAHLDCRRMYVSPALDGWTLVFGILPAVAHATDEDSEEVWRADAMSRSAALSGVFGEAHLYGASCGDGWTAWCIAKAGEVVRFYDVFDPDGQIGDGHPGEEGYLLPHVDAFPDDAFDGVPLGGDAFTERYLQVKRELNIPDEAHATTVAGRLSVDPSGLGPHTIVEGRGVIALTACGLAEGSTPGALRI